MSIIQKSLKECGLKLEGDVLPKNQRKVKVFQRLIAAMRAAEAEIDEQLFQSERERNDALQKIMELQDRNRELEARILRDELAKKMSQIPALTVADKENLLALQA